MMMMMMMMMECGAFYGMTGKKKPKYSEKTCTSAVLSDTNPT
jgi:hypothetical protein